MGEYTEHFTVDSDFLTIKDVVTSYFTGFGYKLIKQEGNTFVFEKGFMRKNVYTFSFEEAYKQAIVSVVSDLNIPVSSVSVSVVVPYLQLKKYDLQAIKTMIRSLREMIIISASYKQSKANIERFK